MNKPLIKNLGTHYIIELIDCDPELISHISSVESGLVGAATASRATIINTHFHQFAPQGVSGVVLIAESHFTIHTWPEDAYAAVDFFTCGRMVPERAIEFLRTAFNADNVSLQLIERGY